MGPALDWTHKYDLLHEDTVNKCYLSSVRAAHPQAGGIALQPPSMYVFTLIYFLSLFCLVLFSYFIC